MPKKTAETLKVKGPKAPKFHILPKKHKIKNPGRPVVSSIGFCRTNILRFVVYHLQLTVKIYLLTFKIQMTFWIRSVLQKTFKSTMDVKSLYTIIPDSVRISVVKAAYESYPKKFWAIKAIITFLSLILIKQLHVQLQKLLTNKRWCNGNNYWPQVMQTNLWRDLKRNIYTHILKTK